ncbi:MAG TPA: HIT family protein [Ramlibacter sp.]|jgi:diadenosine tetraphosphate (Ap4A) HIT family hydrolase|uniref:HIT family protein n=1 Tax=Ramlibacter sp. TaxID=1917967 RepID=UPI002D456641|nr:HIT family protein [Ramlibacter sp.]HZY17597.1 HIT family protein [Ramlibacter sp.]
MAAVADCPLCDADGGVLVVRTPPLRLIRAQEAGFPGFYRVVWHGHVAEFTDLAAPQRALCMEAVAQVEVAMRRHLSPDKVNLAALGNQVPHLHWHVIARYRWDSHFPAPVWAAAQRPAPADRLAAVEAALPAMEQELAETLRRLASGHAGT